MQYEHITTDAQLVEFCESLASARWICFDTEFVSEDRYRPDLCLIQVEAEGRLAVIDPQTIDDVTPFWDWLAAEGHQTIVHAGREEVRFGLTAIGKRPHNLFDIQLAAGMIGLEYPAAYRTLVSKLLDKTLHKGETRTNWRRRPLSDHQIDYALQDVVHLRKICDKLTARLEELGRLAWLETERDQWLDDIERAESSERWQRVSGVSGLSPRSLAIVRELWRWREAEAQRRDQPPRRVLRDDLIVELARRRVSGARQIRAVRGLDRRDFQRHIPKLAECIDRALKLSDDECPRRENPAPRAHLNLLGQFLTTALAGICRSEQIAPGIVGSAQDLRDLASHLLELPGARRRQTPSLATGWRKELVGQRIEELLAGKLAIRVEDPLSDHPLTFDRRQ